MYKVGIPIVVVYQANNSATGLIIAMGVYDETHALDAGKSVAAMTEVGTTGRYYASFTPDAEGEWVTIMYDTSPPYKGHAVKAHRVVGHDIDSIGDLVAAIKAKTDLIPEGGIAEQPTSLAIKAKTDSLPSSPAPAQEYDSAVDAIKSKTDNLPIDPASNTQISTKPSLAEIEASAILGKEATAQAIKTTVDANLDAAISSRATPLDIQTYSTTRIIRAPSNLQLIAKSVSQYYRGQIGTLVVMAKFAGAPTNVDVYATIYYPDDSEWYTEEQMTPIGATGLYRFNFTIPTDIAQGVYKVKYRAVKSVALNEITDNFTEEDGPPTNWIYTAGTWNVVSNVLKQQTTPYAYLHWADPLALEWGDYTFEAKIRADADVNNFLFGLMPKYASRSKTYAFYYSKYRNKLSLAKGTSDVKDVDKTLYWNTWYNFKVEIVGPQIKCYLDAQLELEWIDLDPLYFGAPTLYCAQLASFDDVKIIIPASEYQEFEISDFSVDDGFKGAIEFQEEP